MPNKLIKCLEAACKDYHQLRKQIDNLISQLLDFRLENIQYYNQQWDDALLIRIGNKWTQLEPLLKDIEETQCNIKKELNPEGRLFKELEKGFLLLSEQYYSLMRMHIRCVLQSAKQRFQYVHMQPKQLIENAVNSGLPKEALCDPTLNKLYRDPITHEWIQFPLKIIIEKGDKCKNRYYCVNSLEKLMENYEGGKPIKFPGMQVNLSLKNFKFIEEASSYIPTLNNYLMTLANYHFQCILDETKKNFNNVNCQPAYIIGEAIENGFFVENLPQVNPFKDPITGNWIHFPVCLITEANKIQYYCATTLEWALSYTSWSGLTSLLTGIPSLITSLKDFHLVDPHGPYLKSLYNCLPANQLRKPMSNMSLISHVSLFSEAVSDQNSVRTAQTSISSTSDQESSLIGKTYISATNI